MGDHSSFNYSQSSLVFINCCFALSLTGVLLLLQAALAVHHSYLFWWSPLAVYLVFVIWRQYSLYYIPLQYFRNIPETESEEFATLSITILLFVYMLLAAGNSRATPWLLLTIIALNIIKVHQMKCWLKVAPKSADVARSMLRVLSWRLMLYLCCLLFLNILLWTFTLEESRYALTAGFIPLVGQILAQALFVAAGPKLKMRYSPQAYLQSISDAWN
jgi:hypothetical protein